MERGDVLVQFIRVVVAATVELVPCQRRVLLHQHAVFALAAVTHQFRQVCVVKLLEKDHLRLLKCTRQEHQLRLMAPASEC
jgi:hypothetical protein